MFFVLILESWLFNILKDNFSWLSPFKLSWYRKYVGHGPACWPDIMIFQLILFFVLSLETVCLSTDLDNYAEEQPGEANHIAGIDRASWGGGFILVSSGKNSLNCMPGFISLQDREHSPANWQFLHISKINCQHLNRNYTETTAEHLIWTRQR